MFFSGAHSAGGVVRNVVIMSGYEKHICFSLRNLAVFPHRFNFTGWYRYG